ncbi:MAG: integrase core domain-containing protein [Burkholderia sp.]
MGDRFAALEPISQGVREQFGSVEADAVRGLSLRMDHGSQYRSDDFRAPLKFWGITPSYAFVAEPQTNGVAERFNRTMKEQAIHGRLFNSVEEVCAAAVAFKERYNCEWRLETTGLQAPPRSPSGTALATCRLIAKSCLNNPIRYTLRASSVAACAISRIFTFFNISDPSLDGTFYPKSVSRKTGAATRRFRRGSGSWP